tara:strand:+ start:40 stop:276 length:237 start_codon:yes stop_codon:yes gene_type:complete
MTNKTKWEIERDKQDRLKVKSMKSLTVDQLNAIKETHNVLVSVTQMIAECSDLYLSDIRQLENAMWKLKHQFVLENDE